MIRRFTKIAWSNIEPETTGTVPTATRRRGQPGGILQPGRSQPGYERWSSSATIVGERGNSIGRCLNFGLETSRCLSRKCHEPGNGTIPPEAKSRERQSGRTGRAFCYAPLPRFAQIRKESRDPTGARLPRVRAALHRRPESFCVACSRGQRLECACALRYKAGRKQACKKCKTAPSAGYEPPSAQARSGARCPGSSTLAPARSG